MATHSPTARFSYRLQHAVNRPDAVWWPRNRSFADQLPALVALWPAAAGHISRVLYSPPDWDDHPRQVDVGDRIMKTGCFPQDDTHLVTLTLATGEHRTVLVIAPETTPSEAQLLLGSAVAAGHPDWDNERHPEWDNEGGHVEGRP
jgi:hypothetical protein